MFVYLTFIVFVSYMSWVLISVKLVLSFLPNFALCICESCQEDAPFCCSIYLLLHVLFFQHRVILKNFQNYFLILECTSRSVIALTISYFSFKSFLPNQQGCKSLLSIKGDNLHFYPVFNIGGDEPRPRFISDEQINWRPKKKSSSQMEHFFPRIQVK